MQANGFTNDMAPVEAREAWLIDAVRSQIAYMRKTVPFWEMRLAEAGIDETGITELADLARIPMLSKAQLRNIEPAALLPESSGRDVAFGRWTSGTSGRPTVNFWTKNDWNALVAVTASMLGRHVPSQSTAAFNAYSQAHVTGPVYSAALRKLGGSVFERSHHSEELFATMDQMALFPFDTLVIPGKSKDGKATGLAELIGRDPEFLAQKGVRWWIGSSGTFDQALIEQVQRQGVEAITNLYGSSEFAMLACSCTQSGADYHVAQGHVLVEVVDDNGQPVKSGEFGRIVVTHLRGVDGNGNACEHTGTQILRLAAGDGGTLVTEPCDCGLTTPRLRGVRRIEEAATPPGDFVVSM